VKEGNPGVAYRCAVRLYEFLYLKAYHYQTMETPFKATVQIAMLGPQLEAV
jgi:hypothetical protein